MDDKIQKLMKSLGISEEEALAMLEDDKRIDRGEKLFELPEELKPGAKKARQADRKPTERKPREKKVDADKLEIIGVIDDALCDLVDNVQLLNPERELIFTYNDRKFKITLSCPRS